jgi:hypothetical protein
MLKLNINNMSKEDWNFVYNIEGMTITDLSKHFNVNITTIGNRLKK